MLAKNKTGVTEMDPFRKGVIQEVYNPNHPSRRIWIEDDTLYLKHKYSMFSEDNFYYGYKECIKKGIEYQAPDPEIENNMDNDNFIY